MVGWLMSEFAVCRNGGGVSLGRLGLLLKGWLVKLVDNIILVFSFSSFIFCFLCRLYLFLERLPFSIFRVAI